MFGLTYQALIYNLFISLAKRRNFNADFIILGLSILNQRFLCQTSQQFQSVFLIANRCASSFSPS
jgi:hypothetical protein